METQATVASIFDGDRINLVTGTQWPSNTQEIVASNMGLTLNKVNVVSPRVGGAFGGKITRNITAAVITSLCAYKIGRPVRMQLSRTTDMNMQSGREAWLFDYEVGFDSEGKINALNYEIFVDAGYNPNDTGGSAFMGMVWADNAYFLPNYEAKLVLCKTNTPPRTSMRTPGVLQSNVALELVLDRIAAILGLPTSVVQQRNFIKDGLTTICGQVITDCNLENVWKILMNKGQYYERLKRVNQYNNANIWRKKGLAICPVKYGISSEGYQAGVSIGVNIADGSVVVTHTGIEMGQGINTKVCQAVAMGLGLSIKNIQILPTSSNAISNGGCTGGSATSESVVKAALNACEKLNLKLAPFRQKCNISLRNQNDENWIELLSTLPSNFSLNVEGWYSPISNSSGGPVFQYYVYAACITEIDLDVLSGNVHVLSSDIEYDCGQSLNPAVDIGQIEGGLVMGLGYFLTEDMKYDPDTAELISSGTWNYKVPLVQDSVGALNLSFLSWKEGGTNKDGILRSKAVGEPPMIVSNSVYFALRHAISSCRKDARLKNQNAAVFDLPIPATVKQRVEASLLHLKERFLLPK